MAFQFLKLYLMLITQNHTTPFYCSAVRKLHVLAVASKMKMPFLLISLLGIHNFLGDQTALSYFFFFFLIIHLRRALRAYHWFWLDVDIFLGLVCC